MRYSLELSYKGTHYCGWQRQPHAPSVQQTVEESLSLLLREGVQVTGAGRTDTGVHASHYVAHFDTETDIWDGEDFLYHVNSILPADIALKALRQVDQGFHARFDAREREYTYYIIQYKDPFRRDTSWQYFVPLDMDRMNGAAQWLLKYEDFTSFAKLNSGNKTNLCRVNSAVWCRGEREELIFKISADRFLRNMVRSIVGTLVDVGRGKITSDCFRTIIEARDLSLSSGSAPARGLFLTDLKY